MGIKLEKKKTVVSENETILCCDVTDIFQILNSTVRGQNHLILI
jgi:hypothetical protein